jgi:Uma2 family endonuclease
MDASQLAPDRIIYPDCDDQPMSESDATRDYLIYSVEVLRLYFQSRQQIYVSGNLFIYYQEGNPQAAISPDVFVIFGVSNRQRRSYKTWQEGDKLPAFILEVTSLSTKKRDQVEKPQLYASLGVQEYFQYDPTADYLKPQLQGSHLVNGVYQPLPLQQTANTAFIHSSVLGLDLQLQAPSQPTLGIVPLPKELRFYDPQAGLKLLNRREAEQLRRQIEQERDQAQEERDQAQQERDQAQQRAERLAAQLRALGVDAGE